MKQYFVKVKRERSIKDKKNLKLERFSQLHTTYAFCTPWPAQISYWGRMKIHVIILIVVRPC